MNFGGLDRQKSYANRNWCRKNGCRKNGKDPDGGSGSLNLGMSTDGGSACGLPDEWNNGGCSHVDYVFEVFEVFEVFGGCTRQ